MAKWFGNWRTRVLAATVVCTAVIAPFDWQVAVATLLFGTSALIDIDVPWGGTLPAALGVYVVAAVLTPLHIGIPGIVVSLGVIAACHPRQFTTFSGRLAYSTLVLDASVAIAAGTLLHRWDAFGDMERGHANGSLIIFVGLVGAALSVVDYFVRFRPLPPTKYSFKHVVQMYAALVCEAAFVVLGWQLHNWLAVCTGLVMCAMTWYFCRNYRVASATHEQSVMAVGLLPEVAGFSPIGHAERSGVYAERLAERLGFGPIERERIRTAARVMRIGYVHFPEPEAIADGMAVPTRDELVSATDRVLSQAPFLAEIEPLVRAALINDDPDVTLEVAILRVVSSFDDFVSDDEEHAPLAAMRMLELFSTGPLRQAAVALADLVASDGEFVARAQATARPLFDAAADARRDIIGE